MPLIGGPLIANGDSGPLLTEDLITDTSKKITNTDYYDVVIQGLKVNKEYVSQFRWQYEDGTFGEWSNSYEFTTDDELDPDTPSTPILVTGVGFFTVRWNGNNSTGQALTDFSQINVYVSGGSFNASLPAATLTQAGTANIAAAIGSYSVTFKALRSSGKISDSSTSASVSITTDSSDASAALVAANQAQLAAGVAQATANGKNKVTYSTSAPGSTSNTAGDIWFRYSGSGVVIEQHVGLGGTSWQQQEISSAVIGNLDAGKITTGILNVGIGITGTNGSFTLNAITGSLTATSVDISGSVTATSGSFTGSLYSSVGTIGGWTIGADGFSSSSIELKSQNYTSGATTGALKLKSNFEEYAVYAADGDFGIKDMGNFIDVLFYNVDLNRVFVGSSTTTVKAGKSYSLNSSGLRNIYASSTAGDPSIASPVEGDIKLEW